MDNNKLARYVKTVGALVLAAAVAVFVFVRLSSSESMLPSQYELAEAVPVDAAAVMFASSCGRTAELLGPKSQLTGFFDALSADESLWGALKDKKNVVSWHFSGKLVPLLILDDDSLPSDSLAFRLRSLPLKGIVIGEASLGTGRILLVSPSKELVNSSQRHIREGVSVVSHPDFESAVNSISAQSLAVISNEYVSRIVPGLRGFSSWISISLDGSGADFELTGRFVGGDPDISLSGMLSKVQPCPFRFPSVAPRSISYAVAVSLNGYRGAYETYLDKSSQLNRNRQQLSELGRRCGANALTWAGSFQELVLLNWSKGKTSMRAVLVRSASAIEHKEMGEDGRSALIPLLFGREFTPAGSFSVSMNDCWMAFGDKTSLSDLLDSSQKGDTLEELLKIYSDQEMIPSASALVYNSLDTDNSSLFGRGVDAQVSAFAGTSAFAPLSAYFIDGAIHVRAIRHETGIDN